MVLVIYIKSNMVEEYDWTDMTWGKLVSTCPALISPTCNDANLDKTVKNWRGFVMRVEDRRESMRRYYDYALELYIKMEPAETDRRSPDLYLTASSGKVYDLVATLDQLGHGDEVMFNATFTQPSRSFPSGAANRHLHIVDLLKTGSNNQDVEVYMTKKEEEYYSSKVEGKV